MSRSERPAGARKEDRPAMRTYVLVQTNAQADHIARLLQEVPGVEFAEDVRGPYDALAMTRTDPDGDGLPALLDRIRSLPGVIRALAAPAARPETARQTVDAA